MMVFGNAWIRSVKKKNWRSCGKKERLLGKYGKTEVKDVYFDGALINGITLIMYI